MTPVEIYQIIHQNIVDFWTMFLPVPSVDAGSFEFICYNFIVYGTQFFLGFLVVFIPWRILKSIFGGI